MSARAAGTRGRGAGRATPAALVVPAVVAALAAVTAVLVLALAPARAAAATDPELVAGASLLLPGVGQAANGDYLAGATHFGLALYLSDRYAYLIEREDYIEPDDREDDTNDTIRINETTFKADLVGTALLNLSFYSSFSAYRDARNQPENLGGYTTPAPEESLTDLALSPFRWEFLSRPGTFLPLLIPLYFAATPADEDDVVYAPDDTITRSEMRRGFFFQHGMVAVGEESFFRGVLNNGFSDWLGPGLGLAASSVAFGLPHSGDAGAATPVAATLFGAYLGWLHQTNDYRLGQSVTVHFWWNFLTSLALLRDRDNAQVELFSLYLEF